MKWSDIPRSPSEKTLRQFAGLWLVFLLGSGCWQYLMRGRPILGEALGVLALTVGPLGLAWPRAVRPIFVGWMVLVFPIGWLVSHVLLALVFYGLFTPLGLLFRLAGRDMLGRRQRKDASTYWRDYPQVSELRRYLRQY